VAFAESPVAGLVEGDIKHRANLLTKKSAKLKIQNTIIVPDEGRFLQNATGIAHRHTLANSQIFPLHRVHTATSLIAHLTLQAADYVTRAARSASGA
jgi:hypothetical protein